MHFVDILVVMLLVMRKSDSSVFECYIVCHIFRPVYTYSVANVHIVHSLKRSTLKLKCTHLLNCVILFCLLSSLS
jgi:hypothetical protein